LHRARSPSGGGIIAKAVKGAISHHMLSKFVDSAHKNENSSRNDSPKEENEN
jgi:hypothetical protein